MHRELPTHPREELEGMIETCKREQPGGPDRKQILKCVQRKVS